MQVQQHPRNKPWYAEGGERQRVHFLVNFSVVKESIYLLQFGSSLTQSFGEARHCIRCLRPRRLVVPLKMGGDHKAQVDYFAFWHADLVELEQGNEP